MVVCRQKWPFFYDTFLKIFPTNFIYNFLASCSISVLCTHQVSCLWKPRSWGIQELEHGYPTANEEHEPFVVYETFLKNVPFKRFLLVALYTPSALTKFHLFGNSLGGVPGSSNFGTRLNMVVCRQKWPFFYDTFLKIFPTNFFKKFSCQLLYMCPLYLPSFMSLKTP